MYDKQVVAKGMINMQSRRSLWKGTLSWCTLSMPGKNESRGLNAVLRLWELLPLFLCVMIDRHFEKNMFSYPIYFVRLNMQL